MQNRYVGDVGDYLKLGILRALSPGYHLGVAWLLFPDEDHNRDGRHISYLNRLEQWRRFDPQLFDALGEIVSSGRRDVRALEDANILTAAIFHNDLIPQHEQAREVWFRGVQRAIERTDLLFVDPDNGLEPEGYSYGAAKSAKSILLSELRKLARPGCCVIVYHHHTRRRGGHHSEIEHWSDRLRGIGFTTVDALRCKP